MRRTPGKDVETGEIGVLTTVRTGGAAMRPTGLADEVYELILGQLMALKIPPGARITIDALVRELNVSHTPIREALGRLEADGLVVKTHLVGYRAAPQVTKKQFEEIYELRLLLEPHAARHAATALGAPGITALSALTEEMVGSNAGGDRVRYNRFAQKDADFTT